MGLTCQIGIALFLSSINHFLNHPISILVDPSSPSPLPENDAIYKKPKNMLSTQTVAMVACNNILHMSHDHAQRSVTLPALQKISTANQSVTAV